MTMASSFKTSLENDVCIGKGQLMEARKVMKPDGGRRGAARCKTVSMSIKAGLQFPVVIERFLKNRRKVMRPDGGRRGATRCEAVSMSIKAGLQFPVGRVERFLKNRRCRETWNWFSHLLSLCS